MNRRVSHPSPAPAGAREINRPFHRPAAFEPAPETSIYRGRTLALLRRYFRQSIEIGRLPSLVGREVFGSRVSAHRVETFEDIVVFVHDVERCLMRLDEFSQQLIARVVFQEYTLAEAAVLLGIGRRTAIRKMPGAIDRFSEILIEAGLLRHRDLTRSPRHPHPTPAMQELEEVLELPPDTLEASCDALSPCDAVRGHNRPWSIPALAAAVAQPLVC